jgi:4-hydroxybenzoate polyprenyltransferase
VKVVDDAQDYDYDRSISKRTVAVVVGMARAHRVAYGLMLAALVAVAGLAATPLFPRGAALAALAFLAVVAYARRAGPELATMLLIRGSYVFLALLVASVWFEPLQ